MPQSIRLSLSIAATGAVALASLSLSINPASATRFPEGTTSSISVVEASSNASQFNLGSLRAQGASTDLVGQTISNDLQQQPRKANHTNQPITTKEPDNTIIRLTNVRANANRRPTSTPQSTCGVSDIDPGPGGDECRTGERPAVYRPGTNDPFPTKAGTAEAVHPRDKIPNGGIEFQKVHPHQNSKTAPFDEDYPF